MPGRKDWSPKEPKRLLPFTVETPRPMRVLSTHRLESRAVEAARRWARETDQTVHVIYRDEEEAPWLVAVADPRGDVSWE